MKRSYVSVLLTALLFSFFLNAQQGIHGPRTVTAANTIVNEYTAVTANVLAGSTTITVANSALNANGRFTGNLAPGDMIMIYQPVGAIIRNQFDVANGADTTWGRIDPGNYYGCGRYEFQQVRSVPNATTIELECGTTYDYYAVGGTPRKVQVIRVPRFTTLTINAGGVLTCDDWNGTVGGVLVVEVQGNTVINAGGSIDATARGFRGGSLVGDNATTFGSNTTFSTNNTLGAEKGEGVAGYQAEYDVWGGRYCRAPGANGGGGGDAHNAGGGGGANAPNSTSATAFWSGNGIPDQSLAAWTTAWSIEPPAGTMNLRTAANSSGGGRGGYTFSGSNQNATTLPPGNAGWGGDARNHQATGLGGRPLDYTSGRLFFGGGGGAGDQNNSGGGVGGDGGGLIYLMCFGTISGNGTVVSNGTNGANGQGGTGVITGIDAGGGGGAGGTVVLNAIGGVANTLTVNTNGGEGGDQVINLPFSTNEGEGPGGGGGGGYIAVSSGTPARNSNGGNNGTTNSQALTEFIPNGATRGCPGTNNATITNFDITLTDITICTGNSTTLTAVISGTPPPGYVINWYTSPTGGVPFFTGASYTTPALGSTTTYWVGTCAGWWREPVTVTVGPAPNVTASASTNPICSGGSTTLTAAGATTYNWMPGNINGNPVTVSPATTTTYTVTGTLGPGCASTATITVTVNPTPTVTATASSPTICAGSSTTLTGNGATSYNWMPGNINGSPISVSPATTTTYTVTGTTAGCSSTAQVTVTVNPSPTVTATAASPTICAGGSTTLTGNGATSYNWMPGNINGSPITVSPAATTTYTVTGTGANGCTSTAQVTVTVNPTPTVTATAANPTICNGGSTTLTGNGATSYNWMPGNINGSPITVSPAATTTYTVTGTGANGCTGTAQVTVTVNPTPTVTATAAATPICTGDSTTLTGNGATSYNWMPGNVNGSPITVSPAATTTYTVTGTGANGCTSTAQVTVTVNPTPTVTATAANPTICSGGSTTLTGNGATSYNWMPGNISGSPITVSPAATTTYTVTGTGGNGCTSTAQVTVTVNPTPTVTATAAATPICAGDSTTLTGNGATSYNWMPGNVNGSPITVTPAATTTYTVTGTAANGCTSTAQVTVTINPLPTPGATATPATICAGQTSTLAATGGTAYNWNGGSLVNATGTPQTVSPVTTTTYTVLVTDGNGCSDSTQVTLTVNPVPVADAGTDQTICSGNPATLTATGGGTYSWNGGTLVNASGATQTDSPGTTTSYTVTVTNGFGCTDEDTIVVNVNLTPTIAAGADTALCTGDTIQLSATGAGTYNWNPATGLSNATISNPQAFPSVTTTYTVTLTAANGCAANDTITVNVNARPTATASNDTTVCEGTSVNLAASGGGTYSWNGGTLVNAPGATQTVNPAITTSYTVVVTAANGCTDEDTISIAVNALPATAAGPDVSICPNSSIQLNATGATNYSWSPAAGLDFTNISNPVASPAVTTTYIVTGTSAQGCTFDDTITVTVSNNLSVFAGPDVMICTGDTVLLTTGGGATYSWSPAATLQSPSSDSTNAFPSTTTTYTVQVTDANNCTGTDSVTVFVNGPVSLTTAGATTICIGQSATISATPANGNTPYTFTWSNSLTGPGPHTVSPTVTTTYSVSVTDSLGCSSSQQTVTVTVNPPLAMSVLSNAVICQGGNASLTANVTGGDGNYTYDWQPGNLNTSSINVSPAATTTYTVIVSDGCGTPPDTVTATVTVNPTPVPTVQANVTSGCAPVCVDFTGQSSSNCATSLWDFGDSTTDPNQNPTHCFTTPGTYDITYTCTDAAGCTGTVTMTNMITVFPNPVAAFTSTPPAGTIVVTPGNAQQVCFTDNSTGAATWDWTFGVLTSTQQSPCFTVSDTGAYCGSLITTSADGCTDTAEACFLAVSEAVFSVPNVFTPNADGTNDLFTITGTGIKELNCEIYDRWGVKVYEWNSVTGGWDGHTTSGLMAADGVYYYVMQITDFADTQTDVHGFVQLIKAKP